MGKKSVKNQNEKEEKEKINQNPQSVGAQAIGSPPQGVWPINLELWAA